MRFADTSWWVAWSMPGDSRHPAALRAVGSVGTGELVLTSNLIVGETWTFLRRRAGHAVAVGFLDRVRQLVASGRLLVERVDERQEVQAWDWLRRHDERVYSFVDATSFRMMKDRRLIQALAFDKDFAAAGFVEVDPGPD